MNTVDVSNPISNMHFSMNYARKLAKEENKKRDMLKNLIINKQSELLAILEIYSSANKDFNNDYAIEEMEVIEELKKLKTALMSLYNGVSTTIIATDLELKYNPILDMFI